MKGPTVSLALNTGFAAGRWSGAGELFYLGESVGVGNLEINVRTECDPLLFGSAYVSEWLTEIVQAGKSGRCRVRMLSWNNIDEPMIGLAANSESVRARLRDRLFKPLIDCACQLESGLTLSCHAISNSALQQPNLYREQFSRIVDELTELSYYGRDRLSRPLSVEPSPAPHVPPWCREDAGRIARAADGRLGIYIDTGRIGPQRNFTRPAREHILAAIERARNGAGSPDLWLGPVAAEAELRAAAEELERESEEMAYRIEQIASGYPYLFAEEEDAEPAVWLEELGPNVNGIRLSAAPGAGLAERLRELLSAYRRGLEHNGGAAKAPSELLVTLDHRPETATSGQELLRRIAGEVAELRTVLPEDDTPLESVV